MYAVAGTGGVVAKNWMDNRGWRVYIRYMYTQ